MKTVNEQIRDAMVRHQTFLLRYSGYIRNRINSILSVTEEGLAEKIRDRLSSYTGLSTPVEWQRLQRLLKQLEAMRMGAWDRAREFLETEAVQLAYQEPIFLDKSLKNLLPVVIETTMPSTNMLKAIALSRPFDGRLLKDWASTMAVEDVRRIHSAIQVGMTMGEDNRTIARRVVGTRALKGTDGATEVSRRQVAAITRTAVIHIANSARAEFFKENKTLVETEYFVATLDARTTVQCASLDGQRFPMGKGPQPPLHWNCRSLRVAALDGDMLGDRPAKPYTESELAKEYAELNKLTGVSTRDDLPRGTKGAFDQWKRKRIRQLVGPIPASTTFKEWLKQQSETFQDETLGVTKAKLFRDGGLSLDKFTNRNGDELTLAQLAQREEAAFRAAGLDPDKYRP